LKHISQAWVLSLEWRQGYAEHYDLALGHLAEASDELVQDFPVLAAVIRSHRKEWETDPLYVVPFVGLLESVRDQTGYSVLRYLIQPKESVPARVIRFFKIWAPALLFSATTTFGK
jgi:hypothetical protein